VQQIKNYTRFCAFTNPCIFAAHTPSNFLEGKASGRDFQLSLRQRVAAIGRRSATPCKSEDGLGQQLALFQVYHHFVLLHASVRQALAEPVPTNGRGSTKVWRPCTPAMAAGLTDH